MMTSAGAISGNLRAESLPPLQRQRLSFRAAAVGGDLGTNNLPPQSFTLVINANIANFQTQRFPCWLWTNRPLENWLKPVAGEPLTFRTAKVGRPADVI